MDKEQNIRKSISQYFLATIIGNVFGLFRNIFLPFVYNPVQLGVWNLMNVLLSYSANMHLGVLHGMNKLIPFFNTKKDYKSEKILISSVFWFNLFLAIITLIGFFISSFYFEDSYKIPLIIIGIAALLQQLFAYYFSLLRSNGKFKVVSIGTAILSILTFLFILFITNATKFKIEGGLISIAIANILVIFYFQKSVKISYSSIDLTILRKALGTGLPLIIIGIFDTLLVTIDRWLIASNYSKALLGNYALGIMTSSLISVIPGVISSVIYPKLIQKFTSNNEIKDFSNFIIQPIKSIWILMFLLTGISIITIPFLITNFLPKYTDSINLVEIFIIGSYFFSSTFAVGSVLIAINKQKSIIYLQSFVIILISIIDIIIIKNKLPVNFVAIGTIVGYFIYGLGYNIIAFYFLKFKFNNILNLLYQLTIPFLCFIFLFFYFSKFNFLLDFNNNIYVIYVAKIFIFLIILMILIIVTFFDRKYKIFFFTEIKKILY